MLVSLGLLFNGERHGGPAGGDEMYYLWIVLWAAYYLSRRALALQVAFVLAAYATTLVAHRPRAQRHEPLDLAQRPGDRLGRRRAAADGAHRGPRRRPRGAATTDPLTGLPNRRGLEEAYARTFASHQRSAGRSRSSWPTSIASRLNDQRGHSAGDLALAEVAEVLRREVREVDTAARIGGDEFAVLLPETDGDAAARIAAPRRGRHRRARPRAGWPAGISLGVGVSDTDGTGVDDLMRRADARMYGAKRDPRRRDAA